VASNKFWTKAEDNILKKHYGKIPSEELEKKFTGRTMGAIEMRTFTIGIRNNDDWTEEQDQFLFDNVNMTTREVSDHLKKTYGSVVKRRKFLGVPKRNTNKCIVYKKRPIINGFMVKATYSLKEDVKNPFIAKPNIYKRTMRYPTEPTKESATNRALDSMLNHMKVVNVEIKEVIPL
jgi:hypothetical protein